MLNKNINGVCYLSRMIAIALIVFRIVRPAKTGTKTEIGQLDVAIAIDKNVVWFNITMNESHFMYAFNGTH